MLTDMDHHPRVRTLIDEFSAPDCNPLVAQYVIGELGRTLGERIRDTGADVDVVCPILRAGLPFAVGLGTRFPRARVAPIHARRHIGTGTVAVERVADVHDGDALLLVDTIAATGRTLVTLGRLLSSEWSGLTLQVAIGYASPEALEVVSRSGFYERVWVARIAGGVDAAGYLFPATNGDAGDKMFGGML